MEIVDDYSDIIVDIAVTDYAAVPTREDASRNAAKNWWFGFSLHRFYSSTNSLYRQAAAYPGLDIRYYF